MVPMRPNRIARMRSMRMRSRNTFRSPESDTLVEEATVLELSPALRAEAAARCVDRADTASGVVHDAARRTTVRQPEGVAQLVDGHLAGPARDTPGRGAAP